MEALLWLVIKGELQRQNKLISLERPFKILQDETKIIKIGQAVSRDIQLKRSRFGQFYETKRQKNLKCCFFGGFHKLKNNRWCDFRNDKCTCQQDQQS